MLSAEARRRLGGGLHITHLMSSFSVARLSRCSRPFRSAQQANCPAHIGCNKIFLDLPVHTPPSNQSKNYNSRSNPSLERPTPRCAGGGMGIPPTPDSLTAPVSRQKRPERNATNEIEIKQKRRKINEPNRCPAAHNGLVAGSSPDGLSISMLSYANRMFGTCLSTN